MEKHTRAHTGTNRKRLGRMHIRKRMEKLVWKSLATRERSTSVARDSHCMPRLGADTS